MQRTRDVVFDTRPERTTGLLELVDRLYATVANPDGWTEFLGEFAARMDGVMPGLVIGGVEPRALALDCPQESIRTFETCFAPRIEDWSRRNEIVGAFTYDDLDIPLVDQLLNDWARPLGVRDSIAIHTSTAPSLAGIGVYREIGAPPFTSDDVAFAGRLTPHLERALALRSQLSAVTDERNLLHAALDRLSGPVMIVSRSCRVISLNAAARRMAETGDGLALERRILRPADRCAGIRLAQLVRDVCERGGPGGTFRVGRPSGRRPYEILVARLPVEAGVRRALVFIGDPEVMPSNLAQRLRRLYGFTVAESKLAVNLFSGASLAEIADETCVTRHTVRNQLRSLFAKTDTRRQAELVALLLRGVAAMPSDELA